MNLFGMFELSRKVVVGSRDLLRGSSLLLGLKSWVAQWINTNWNLGSMLIFEKLEIVKSDLCYVTNKWDPKYESVFILGSFGNLWDSLFSFCGLSFWLNSILNELWFKM